MTDPGASSPNSYDEIPYPSSPKPETHPAHLATLATLLGMHPARPSRCRVLEIGCSDGGNIIPMAYALPDSQFVGIDLAPRQIASGQRLIDAVGITNITLAAADIMQLDVESLGTFDYIIAYGVYSWVPEPVRERLLAFCQAALEPQGVAYISYNVFPGWHSRRAMRDLALYHARQQGYTLQDQARETRRLFELLDASIDEMNTRSAQSTDSYYSLIVKGERFVLSDRPDWYLVHELLEGENAPVYFSEFARQARAHGLSYLCEAEYGTVDPSNLPRPAAAMVAEFATDVVSREQYMDFVRNRMFRQTLLVHQDVAIDRNLTPDRVMGCHVVGRAVPVEERMDLHATAVARFRGPSGTVLTTTMPLAKAALVQLAAMSPAPISFDGLIAAAHQRLEPDTPPIFSADQIARERQAIAELLLRCFTLDLVELYTEPLPFASYVSERPVASALARLQASTRTKVSSLRHVNVDLTDDLALNVLRHLDGQHGGPELLMMLDALIEQGALAFLPGDPRASDPDARRTLLVSALEGAMRWLVQAALLVR